MTSRTPEAVVAEAIHWYGANPQAEASAAEVIVAALREAGLVAPVWVDPRPFGKDTCGVCRGRFSVGDHTDGRCLGRAK
jgi:hypothetical protein